MLTSLLNVRMLDAMLIEYSLLREGSLGCSGALRKQSFCRAHAPRPNVKSLERDPARAQDRDAEKERVENQHRHVLHGHPRVQRERLVARPFKLDDRRFDALRAGASEAARIGVSRATARRSGGRLSPTASIHSAAAHA
eukprot:181164-Pleurochrysis_carterae.AAC.3